MKHLYMNNDILFVVYTPLQKVKADSQTRINIKGLSENHPLNFDLMWCNITLNNLNKDDLNHSEVDSCSTIDDLLFILDEQLN